MEVFMRTQAGSIVEVLLLAAERAPEKKLLRFEGQTWSYANLVDLTRRWSAGLRARCLQVGDRVALFLDNSLAFLGSYFGVQAAGGIVVLVNTQYRQVELRHILSDAEVRVAVVDSPRLGELLRVLPDLPALELIVVCDGDVAVDRIEPSPSTVTLVTADALLAAGNNQHADVPPAESIALIAYTSGTTGRSKGAMLSHQNLIANSRAVVDAWRWTDRDVLLLALPLFHIHGLGVGIHGTVVAGGSVDLRRRFAADATIETLERGGVTMFFGVPTMYTRLIAEARSRSTRPPPLRLYVSGSAPLSAQTFAEFVECFGQPILERYGMTETVMNLTNPYDGERRPGTVGQPFPGQEARIVDLQTREPIEDERPGEIQVRGPHVFKGYWKRSDATAEALNRDGWFNTGDLGWRSRDGYFTISGRARELIITGGFNVYPREVEEVLLTHPGVAEAAVFGLPDPEYGEQVVAAVVPRSPKAVPAEELVAYCRDQLASYKKPRRIHFVDQLPRNALGKVQKHVLREQLG
jgi:malonyl-CoA/methylmalonyl-CoA synthetase